MVLAWALTLATNSFSQNDSAILSPYIRSAVVTPSDTEDLPEIPRAICAYKSSGTHTKINVMLADDTTPSIFYVVSGDLLPLRVRRVYSTDTDATHVTVLY